MSPSVWRTLGADAAAGVEHELAREITPGHVLHGARVRAVARRNDQDYVAFEVEGRGLCIVHLTYRRESRPEWPSACFVDALPEGDE